MQFPESDPRVRKRALLKQIIRVFEIGHSAEVDALVDPNYVDHQGVAGTEVTGADGFRRVVAAAQAAFPNLQVTIRDFVTEDDRIVVRLRWHGASAADHTSERETLDVLELRNGRLTEHWGWPVEAPLEHYRPTDWIDPRIEIRPSSVHGRGMFARSHIAAGDVVTTWGGEFVLTEPDLSSKHVLGTRCSLGTIGEGRYLARILSEGEEDLSNLLNHSCDPNLWMHDEVTLGARRDISSGEELTLDYAMIEDHEEWIGPFECRCGSPYCRGRFTGKDWRREDLQMRYGEHFSPFIHERIRRLGST